MGRGESDDQKLMRIVAILVSFAGLALRASCASWPVHCFVLALLRRAEAIARIYAVGAGVPALAPVRIGRDGVDAAAELASLALRFRVLALMLIVAARRFAMAVLPDCIWWVTPIDGSNVTDACGERSPAFADTS